LEQLRTESQARLVVAGAEGDVKPSLIDWVSYLGKVPRGQLEDEFWPHIDVLLLPSRMAEGLPFAILEALQHGKVVAASDSLGLRELVESGAVKPVAASVDECAAALRDIRRNFKYTAGRQQAAWAKIAPLFDPERLSQEWVTALCAASQALASHRSGS
jgi:glycosyltransferase involved in cell wall biosynthesis